MKILDHCCRFTTGLAALAGNNMLSMSQLSTLSHRRHRSNRLQRENRNVVSFSDVVLSASDSESSDDDVDESMLSPDSKARAFLSEVRSEVFSEKSFIEYHEALTAELDDLVRLIRRNVQTLTRAPQGNLFEVFAFSLEDWDL